MSTTTRAEARRELSRASILSVPEAVVELGGRAVDARRWLEQRGLIRKGPNDRRVVVWGRVLDELEAEEAAPEPVKEAPKRVGRLPRKQL